MVRLFVNEWKKIFLAVLATTAILTVFMSVMSCTMYQDYSLQHDLEAWEIGTELFTLLFPLFVVVPLCWNLYYERKDNFLSYVKPRVRMGKYLLAKWMAYALGTLCIIVIPYIISAIFTIYAKAPIATTYSEQFNHVFQSAFIETPMLYATVLSLWRGVISLLVMTFGFVLAMYCKNVFVILTGSFMYFVLENFILSILRLEQYRLAVAFDPTAVTPSAVTTLSYVTGPVALIIATSLTAFILATKNKVVSV